MLDDQNITNLTIDQISQERDRTVRKIQYSTIDHKGVLASHTISIVQVNKTKRPVETKKSQTLQIYTVDELQELLGKSSFRLIKKYSIDGSRFSEKKSKHMLLVAQKDFS